MYGPGEAGAEAPPVVGGGGDAAPPHPDWPGTPQATDAPDPDDEDAPEDDDADDTTEGDISYPQHQGGANFLLSDGTVVRGKAKAQNAQTALDAAGG